MRTFILILLAILFPCLAQAATRAQVYTTNDQATVDAHVSALVSGPTNGITLAQATNVVEGMANTLSVLHSTNADNATGSANQGVLLVHADGTWDAYGNGSGAFTNAFNASDSGDTIRLGVGTFAGVPANPNLAHPLNIIGAGMPILDNGLRKFVDGTGTIITNGSWKPVLGYSNSVLSDLGIETASSAGVHYEFFWTNIINAKIERVAYNSTADTANQEPVYFSGANLEINDCLFANTRMGHGAIFKGGSNIISRNVTLLNMGGNGLNSIFFEANHNANGAGDNRKITLKNWTIINETNAASPIISIDSGASANLGGGTNDDITFENFSIKHGRTNDVNVFSLSGNYGTDSDPHRTNTIYPGPRVSNIRIIGATVAAPSVYQFAYLSTTDSSNHTQFASNYISDCFVQSESSLARFPVGFNLVTNTDCIRYYNVTLNTNSFTGKDDAFFTAKPAAAYRGMLNIYGGGIRTDSLSVNGIVYPTTNILFTDDSAGGNIKMTGATPTYGVTQLGGQLASGNAGITHVSSLIMIKGSTAGGSIYNNARSLSLAEWADAGTFTFHSNVWVKQDFRANTIIITNGGTIRGPLYSTSSTTNAPAGNEFVVANWVRELLVDGQLGYNSTNVLSGVVNSNTPYQFLTVTQATQFARTYTAPTNNQYMDAVGITNLSTLSGPIVVSAYLAGSGGLGGPSIAVKVEVYYSYDDGVTLLGDWDCQAQTIALNATNRYDFVIPVPYTQFTNFATVYRVFKVTAVTGATRPNFVVWGGGATPSQISYNTAVASQGSASAISTAAFDGPTNALTLDNGRHVAVLSGNGALTNVYSPFPFTWATLVVSNSSATTNTFAITAAHRLFGANSSATVSVYPGKMAYISIDAYHPLWTNIVTATEQ